MRASRGVSRRGNGRARATAIVRARKGASGREVGFGFMFRATENLTHDLDSTYRS